MGKMAAPIFGTPRSSASDLWHGQDAIRFPSGRSRFHVPRCLILTPPLGNILVRPEQVLFDLLARRHCRPVWDDPPVPLVVPHQHHAEADDIANFPRCYTTYHPQPVYHLTLAVTCEEKITTEIIVAANILGTNDFEFLDGLAHC